MEESPEQSSKPEQSSEPSPEKLSELEESPEQSSEQEPSPEKLSELEESPQQPSGQELSPEKLSEQSSEQEPSPEKLSEKSSELSPEQPLPEPSPEQLSEPSPEQLSEPSPEQLSEPSPEQLSELSELEQSSPEQPSEQESSEQESARQESSGQESARQESSGQESSGQESSGQESSQSGGISSDVEDVDEDSESTSDSELEDESKSELEEDELKEEREESDIEEEEEEEIIQSIKDVNIRNLFGKNGLKNVMIYDETTKSNFKYRYEEDEYKIFKPENIGIYSSKIKNICDNIYSNDILSEGIILIYSQYIDSGLIPIALALEEMGFKKSDNHSLFETPPTTPKDSMTMLPLDKKNPDSVQLSYSMITGDKRLSPNNKEQVKELIDDRNKDGKYIKVILISQAGSEGIDFKNIRQVHILEPWYNMNRLEQIFGRAVRNFSHKKLPFSKRNVQLFMHGTILSNKQEESADLYIYRIAELKAKQIGFVTRLLKETAIDCILNHGQTNFTVENLDTLLEITLSTEPKTPILFQVGDVPYSSTCDYLENCNYNCNPNGNLSELPINKGTYTENFIVSNIDKIINYIKFLFKDNFFYKKEEFIQKIKHKIVEKDSITKIYAAITKMIDDSIQLIDKYGRKGKLINIGDYYLFQPLELNNKQITIFDRSVPIDKKNKYIAVKTSETTKQEFVLESDEIKQIKLIKKYYELAIKYATTPISNLIKFSNDDEVWKRMYSIIGLVISNLNKYPILINEDNSISMDILKEILIDHILDFLIPHDKITLLKHIYNLSVYDDITTLIKKSMDERIINLENGSYGYVLYSDKGSTYYHSNINWDWKIATFTQKKDINIKIEILKQQLILKKFNTIIGFIELKDKTNIIYYKVNEDTSIKLKSKKGRIFNNEKKENQIVLLNKIVDNSDKQNIYRDWVSHKKQERSHFFILEVYEDHINTKYIHMNELTIMSEFILRYYNKINRENKLWFLNYENYNYIYKIDL